MGKDTYKGAVKVARKKLREAYREYRKDLKKARLLRKQEQIKAALDTMGVVNRQIPIVVHESKAVKIPVRVA